jgi:hypothetical protein
MTTHTHKRQFTHETSIYHFVDNRDSPLARPRQNTIHLKKVHDASFTPSNLAVHKKTFLQRWSTGKTLIYRNYFVEPRPKPKQATHIKVNTQGQHALASLNNASHGSQALQSI